MTRKIRPNYQEVFLFPPAVEDWVGADHPARFVREVVEALDLGELERGEGASGKGEAAEPGQGRPHYSDELLLKAWVYGYMSGIRSSRKLERACRENVALIWLLGRQEPDHNTLWRFWRQKQGVIRGVFRQLVGIAVQAGIVGVVLHAVDGTKIGSRASNRSGEALHRGKLKKQLKRVEKWIDQIERAIESHGAEAGDSSSRLPEELTDKQKLRTRIQEALQVLDEQGKDHWNRQEPEARMMPCEGEKRFGYNAQAVVDEQSGMVVAEAVVTEETDAHQLTPMLEETENNVGQTADDTVTDKGYRTDEAIGQAHQNQHSVLVPLYTSEQPETAGPYHKCQFQYDRQRDVCLCPQGRELTFEGLQKQRRQKWKERIYRCHHAAECEVAGECTSSPKGRQVAIGPYHEEVAEQRRRQADPVNRQKLRRRLSLIEPVFGQIKHNLGFRRWSMRDLPGVRTQWSLLLTAYNLNKLLPRWQAGSLQFTH
jgi:transposase